MKSSQPKPKSVVKAMKSSQPKPTLVVKAMKSSQPTPKSVMKAMKSSPPKSVTKATGTTTTTLVPAGGKVPSRRPRALKPAMSSLSLRTAIVSARKSSSAKAPAPHASQQEKAEYRQSRYGDRYVTGVNNDATSHPSACETLRQLDPARDDYRTRLELLEKWRVEDQIPPATTPIQVILLMLQYVDALFFSGLAHADASKTWAAVQAMIPKVLEYPQLALRVKHAIEGFDKRAPAGSRDCPPEEVVFAVVGWLLWKDRPLAALCELTRFLAGSRVMEMDELLVSQLIEPRKPGDCWSIHLHPIEDLKPGKTGEYDESILLDQPLIKTLHSVYVELVRGRAKGDRLWVVSHEDLVRDFAEAMKALRLESFNIVRYSWRHAAASSDLLHQRRSREEVKARFRWKSDKSMSRYTKAARVEKFAQSLPPEVLTYGAEVQTKLLKLFRGTKLRPPFD